MKVIFLALTLFAVASAVPGDYGTDQKSNSSVSKSESSGSVSKSESSGSSKLNETDVNLDWEDKLKNVYHGVKDYFSSKFGNKDEEGSNGKNEHDHDKSSENKGKEGSYGKDEHDNKNKESSYGKDEHDNKGKEGSYGKDERDNKNNY